MRIGQLAAAAGLSAKTLRFYEHAGVLAPPQRGGSGYRDYDDNALARLRFVRAAQAAGLALSEIRQIIAIREHHGATCAHDADLLDRHLNDLDHRIDELTRIRRDVRRLRDRAATLDPAACRADDVCHIITTAQLSEESRR